MDSIDRLNAIRERAASTTDGSVARATGTPVRITGIPTELPDGYRWATWEECEAYANGDPEMENNAIWVAWGDDEGDEADMAVSV